MTDKANVGGSRALDRSGFVELLRSLSRREQDLAEERAELMEQIAAQFCKHKIGDNIACQGYSYRGKHCRVTKITAQMGWRSDAIPEIRIDGLVLKADGQPGKNVVDWSFLAWEDT